MDINLTSRYLLLRNQMCEGVVRMLKGQTQIIGGFEFWELMAHCNIANQAVPIEMHCLMEFEARQCEAFFLKHLAHLDRNW